MAQKRPSKASRPEVAERIAEVLRIRLDSAQFHDVCEYAKEKGWDVSERQIGRYIAAADELIAKRMETRRKRLISRHIAMRESLAARAINAADLRTALATMDSTAKLQGLFSDAKDVKELLKIIANQDARLKDLEGRLHASAGPSTPPAPPTSPPA